MSLEFVKHEKVSLKKHPELNELWLHERIADDTSILGLGEIRLLDRERSVQGGGRLDLLLLDDDNNRRYEVEIQLGATDPSHIIRCMEYWDAEKRRYPGYDHVAVLVAENVTSRFLNVISLLSGSIPMVAIQLDALRVNDSLLLNFTQVLDQTELRIDDTDEEDGGGGQADRDYWDKRVGPVLTKICDSTLILINESGSIKHEFNYLRGYIGLRSTHGVVNNFIHMEPKRTKHFTHIIFRNSNADTWVDKFAKIDIPVARRRNHVFRISVTPDQFTEHTDVIREAIVETVKEFES